MHGCRSGLEQCNFGRGVVCLYEKYLDGEIWAESLYYAGKLRNRCKENAYIMPLDNLTELKRRVPGGKYTLARAIAERARQLQSGSATPLVEVRTPNPLSVAIDEIVQGKITFRFGDEAQDPSFEIVELPNGQAGQDAAQAALVAEAAAALGGGFIGEPAAPETLEETLESVPDEAAASEIES